MYQLNIRQMSIIAPLFHNSTHTMILTCLQGYMGSAWTDNLEQPQSAQIVVGDFCFYAGVPNIELAENTKSVSSSGFLLVIPENKEWEELIEETNHKYFERFYRYSMITPSAGRFSDIFRSALVRSHSGALLFDGELQSNFLSNNKEPVFDKSKLSDYILKLPDGYTLHSIDENIYSKLLQTEQLRDLCSVFDNYSFYKKHGLGFVIMDGKTIVSGASSYTVFDNGIEIEVDTLPAYRRKGLALICTSALILECLKRGLYPSWDAMNPESVALAQKLGYHLDKEYVTYLIET